MTIAQRCAAVALVILMSVQLGCSDSSSRDARQSGPGRGTSSVRDSSMSGLRPRDTATRLQGLPPGPQAPQPVAARGRLTGAKGPAGSDTAEVAIFVRSREAQVRFCYQERGLRLERELAGEISIGFRVNSAARVDSAWIASREAQWSGPGAAAAEECIVQRVTSWRVPARWPPGAYGVRWQLRPSQPLTSRARSIAPGAT
jgi:hypothetical protein